MDIRAKILWWSADRRLRSDKPFVVAVTGSLAKTSTKEAIGAVLRTAYGDDQVRVGYGNLNTLLGLPLAIMGYKIDFYARRITWQWPVILAGAIIKSFVTRLPKYLVVEMGADRPGDIKQLTAHIAPDIGILTLVAESHLMNYQSQEQLAHEKGTLIEAVKESGLAIINRRDPYFSNHLKRAKAHVVEIDCPTSQIAGSVAGLVGKQLNISSEQIGQALTRDWRPLGRMQVHDGKFKLIDDAYNASPTSMRAALEELGKMPRPRVAILGSMMELGEREEQYHREVGELAHKVADLVIGVGELSKSYNPDAWYATSREAADEVMNRIPQGASVLVKGSHSVRMDVIVEVLK